MKSNLIIVLILISFLTSCKKDSVVNNNPSAEQLPPETQEGKNTFGCLVNGKVWIPKESFPNSPLSASYQGTVFILNAYRYDTLNQHFSFSNYFTEPVEIALNTDTSGMAFIQYSLSFGFHPYNNDSTHDGKVTITKVDTGNNIISGRFYFDAIDTSTNAVVHITEGRFDVKY